MIRRLALFLLCTACAAQTPSFPPAVATDAQLKVAANNVVTKLKSSVAASDTALIVADGSKFTANMLVTVDTEIMAVCAVAGNVLTIGQSSCPNIDGRGFDSTQAASHKNNATAAVLVTAWPINSLRKEVEAIEQTLGPNLSNIPSGGGASVSSAQYVWAAQSPGGSLIAGSNVVNLAPVPRGVNGSNANYYLYVSGGTGTPEPCLVTGGSAVSAATSGNLIMTCSYSHSGAWTIQSATAGIAEAFWAGPANGVAVTVAAGVYYIHGPIHTRPATPDYLIGQGQQATILNVASDFPLTAKGVFVVTPPYTSPAVVQGGLRSLTIKFTQPNSTDLAGYTHWPPAIYTTSTWHPDFRDFTIVAAWDGVVIDEAVNGQGGVKIENAQISCFHRGISIDGSYQPTILNDVVIDPEGLLGNQTGAFLQPNNPITGLYLGRIDDLQITNYTNDSSTCADFHTGTGTYAGGLGPSGSVVGMWCDLGPIKYADGDFSMSNIGAGIDFTGGMLYITNGLFASAANVDLITAHPNHGWNGSNTSLYNPTLSISNSLFGTFNNDVHAILAYNDPALNGHFNLILHGNTFKRTPDVAYGTPTIVVNGGGAGTTQATITGNTASPLGTTGVGTFLYLGTDDYHAVSGNSLYGWGITTAHTNFKTRIDDILVGATDSVSANGGTIAPTGRTFHVTASGTPNVASFSISAGFPYKQVTTIIDGAFTYSTGGNIGAAGTAVVGQAITWTYDGGIWYPSK